MYALRPQLDFRCDKQFSCGEIGPIQKQDESLVPKLLLSLTNSIVISATMFIP